MGGCALLAMAKDEVTGAVEMLKRSQCGPGSAENGSPVGSQPRTAVDA